MSTSLEPASMPNAAIIEVANTPRERTRREALQLAWLAAIGVGTVQGVRMIARSVAGPRPPWPGTRVAAVLGPMTTLPPVGAEPYVFLSEHVWWVAKLGGGIALRDGCPHLNGECRVDWKSPDDKFVCPCHGAQFDRDGRFLWGPAGRHMDRFVVRAYDVEKRIVAVTSTDGVLRGAPADSTIVVDQAVGFQERR